MKFGVWLSLVEHLLWEQRAAGSNPAIPTNYSLISPVAEVKVKSLREAIFPWSLISREAG
jgi:hypothetical protein